jgi:hypothetical protein
VVNFIIQPLYLQKNNSRCPLNSRLCRSQGPLEVLTNRKIYCLCLDSNPWIFQPLVESLPRLRYPVSWQRISWGKFVCSTTVLMHIINTTLKQPLWWTYADFWVKHYETVLHTGMTVGSCNHKLTILSASWYRHSSVCFNRFSTAKSEQREEYNWVALCFWLNESLSDRTWIQTHKTLLSINKLFGLWRSTLIKLDGTCPILHRALTN